MQTYGTRLAAKSLALTQHLVCRFDGNGGNADGGAAFVNMGLVTRFSDSNITNGLQINGRIGGILVGSGTTVTVDNTNFLDNTGVDTAFLYATCCQVLDQCHEGTPTRCHGSVERFQVRT